MFIASSKYIAKKPDGTMVELTINVGSPELDISSNNNDYRCKVEIHELSFCEYSYGVDAIQSLCLVVQCIHYAIAPLISEGWKLYFPDDLACEIAFISAFLPTHTKRGV